MKKKCWPILLLILFVIPLSSHAKNSCGLGPTILGGNNSLVSQTVATITDGSFAITNLFAISTGTMGCSSSGIVKVEQQKMYISHTYANLEEEVAKGEGPYLDSLIQLMGCSVDAKQDFIQLSQQNYEQIFVPQDDREQQTEIFLQGITSIMNHPRLQNQCQHLS
ncbi:MAG: DUF3015 family protein [SAR324 cluster bacterium]|nr:DUF3015 family protein [SAR324 cluster bacterium]